MNDDFVPFELAKKLKEKGFNYKCHYCYKNSIIMSYCSEPLNHNTDAVTYSAPTISQVLKWLREKGIHIEPIATTTFATKNNTAYFVLIKHKITATCMDCVDLLEKYALFNDACIAGIEYVLDNLI